MIHNITGLLLQICGIIIKLTHTFRHLTYNNIKNVKLLFFSVAIFYQLCVKMLNTKQEE